MHLLLRRFYVCVAGRLLQGCDRCSVDFILGWVVGACLPESLVWGFASCW